MWICYRKEAVGRVEQGSIFRMHIIEESSLYKESIRESKRCGAMLPQETLYYNLCIHTLRLILT